MDRIEERNGSIYVAEYWPMQDEPVMAVCYYPTGIPARDYREYVGCRADRIGPGEYQPEAKLYSFAPKFALKEYGATKPDFTERVPIPCPKVRKGIDTQYRNGR